MGASAYILRVSESYPLTCIYHFIDFGGVWSQGFHCVIMIQCLLNLIKNSIWRAVVIVWYLDLQLSMQSVPITTNVVSLNSTHG